MDLGIEGRVALVTGGSKGIGYGIAAGLAAEGARVAIAARDPQRVAEAAGGIGAHGITFDSADLDAVPGVIAEAESALGPIDIYVANTGGPPTGPDPLGFTREQWEAACESAGGAASSRSRRARSASRSRRSSSPTRTGRA
jgi:3-oxoacyl-[acyl-carrier protein] reductase